MTNSSAEMCATITIVFCLFIHFGVVAVQLRVNVFICVFFLQINQNKPNNKPTANIGNVWSFFLLFYADCIEQTT